MEAKEPPTPTRRKRNRKAAAAAMQQRMVAKAAAPRDENSGEKSARASIRATDAAPNGIIEVHWNLEKHQRGKHDFIVLRKGGAHLEGGYAAKNAWTNYVASRYASTSDEDPWCCTAMEPSGGTPPKEGCVLLAAPWETGAYTVHYVSTHPKHRESIAEVTLTISGEPIPSEWLLLTDRSQDTANWELSGENASTRHESTVGSDLPVVEKAGPLEGILQALGELFHDDEDEAQREWRFPWEDEPTETFGTGEEGSNGEERHAVEGQQQVPHPRHRRFAILTMNEDEIAALEAIEHDKVNSGVHEVGLGESFISELSEMGNESDSSTDSGILSGIKNWFGDE